ncbi:ribokinase [Spongiactinospora rosea]|uniref:Deoxyribokinase n=1 Tax=Spongiactinospora rosea TaxID=2248750 RepID=A0A366M8H9_9ACTN|nr:ribokinase [Spongiactinospora rosea]RBQ21849.1 ribokinase [Spongiactinospora rosea]
MNAAATGNGAGRRFDVCVLGSFMKDLVASAPYRPRTGETLRGTGFAEFLGGKGVNQAVAAARAGATAAMIGRLGDDRYGQEFIDLLRDEGIDASCVVRDGELGTGVGLPVVEPGGANSIIIVPRANDAMRPSDIARAAPVIAASKVLAVQLELPVEVSFAALRTARENGVLTLLNPAPYTAIPTDIHPYVDILIPNQVEAEQLLGYPPDGEDARSAVGDLCDRFGCRGVVLTLGERGAIVARRDPGTGMLDITPVPASAVTAVDTVGAGDAFCGALAARLARGEDLVAAARFANAAAGIATTRPGAVAGMPYLPEIEAVPRPAQPA